MHSYVYIFFSLSTQLLFFTQLIEAFSIMGETVDMVKEAYTNEKELRLLGELKVLEKNIYDTKEYLETKIESKQDTTLEDQSEYDLNQINYELEKYRYKVSSFIKSNFSSKIKISDKLYCPNLYRQHNPKLDPYYPNWSYRFSTNCLE